MSCGACAAYHGGMVEIRWRGAKIALLAFLSATFLVGTHFAMAVEPVHAPDGPYYHDTWLAISRDGLDVSQGRLVLHHASVPDVCVRQDGRALLYYVDASDAGRFRLAVSLLDRDGQPEAPQTVHIEGEPGKPVDPEAILLPDGRVRLYYVGGRRGAREVRSAVSTDGLSFVREPGARLAGHGVVDPAVVRLGDGAWKMYYALLDDGSGQPCIRSASSPDGLSFTADPGVRFPGAGSPGALALPGGRVRLYVATEMRLDSWVSRDGVFFRREKTVAQGRDTFDPSVVPLASGGYLVAFKSFRQ